MPTIPFLVLSPGLNHSFVLRFLWYYFKIKLKVAYFRIPPYLLIWIRTNFNRFVLLLYPFILFVQSFVLKFLQSLKYNWDAKDIPETPSIILFGPIKKINMIPSAFQMHWNLSLIVIENNLIGLLYHYNKNVRFDFVKSF